VTGGGRGIGLMIARGLLQAGAKVYVSSRKEAELAAAGVRQGFRGQHQGRLPADPRARADAEGGLDER
jgi:NAD(P)-dependent dehydrogenase (short-subunit alcohol dehydrogenase family)